MIRRPGEPTKAQREAHELSHQPPEDWCEFCVRARCVESPHRTAHPDERTGGVPVVAMDLCFMGQKGHGTMMPSLVVKEDRHGEVLAHGPESKNVAGEEMDKGEGVYMVKCALTDIEITGFKRLVLKSGQEPVMTAIRTKVKQLWAREVSPQHSAVRSSASNSLVERAIREAESQARCMFLALQARVGKNMDTRARWYFGWPTTRATSSIGSRWGKMVALPVRERMARLNALMLQNSAKLCMSCHR